jgi:hypothetical protein
LRAAHVAVQDDSSAKSSRAQNFGVRNAAAALALHATQVASVDAPAASVCRREAPAACRRGDLGAFRRLVMLSG